MRQRKVKQLSLVVVPLSVVIKESQSLQAALLPNFQELSVVG